MAEGGFDPVGALRELARDSESGASEILLSALDVLVRSAELGIPEGPVLEGVRLLAEAHPEMVPLLNLRAALEAAGWPASATGLRALREHARSARDAAARAAADLLEGAEVVVTLSWSSTVFRALRLVASRGSLGEVTVAHSLPLGEGLESARRFASLGVRVRLIPDSAVPLMVREADAALVGADAVLSDGSLVNKVGTLSLALACGEFGVPMLVAADLLKVDVWGGFRGLRTSSCEGLPDPPEGVELECPVFEEVPADLVRTYATEEGPLTPGEVVDRARELFRGIFGRA